MLEYEARDALLRSRGFASYDAYLESSIWAEKRRIVLLRAGRRCACCNKRPTKGTHPPTQVHHSAYTEEILLGNSIEGLIAICRDCHKKAEFLSDGTKATLDQANARIDLMRSMLKIPKPRTNNKWHGGKKKKKKRKHRRGRCGFVSKWSNGQLVSVSG